MAHHQRTHDLLQPRASEHHCDGRVVPSGSSSHLSRRRSWTRPAGAAGCFGRGGVPREERLSVVEGPAHVQLSLRGCRRQKTGTVHRRLFSRQHSSVSQASICCASQAKPGAKREARSGAPRKRRLGAGAHNNEHKQQT
jgi:hypothetical protein